ncbi:MAG: hypothetical protein RLZ72_1292 [Actinomycetota bacterium]
MNIRYTGAVAAVALVNLAFGATAANAVTTYSVDLASGTAYTSDNITPPAFFNDTVISLDNDYDLYATDRYTNETVKLTAALDEDGRYSIDDYVYGLQHSFTGVQFDGKFWLWAYDGEEDNYDLLYSDGTVAGTGVVELDLEYYFVNDTAGASDGIYFKYYDEGGFWDAYYFDGTTVTDLNLTDGHAYSYPTAFRNIGGAMSFLVANFNDEVVTQYTALNGVPTAVGPVPDMYDYFFDVPSLKYDMQDDSVAYLTAFDGDGPRLWSTDSATTFYSLVSGAEYNVSDSRGVLFNGALYFKGMYNSDGVATLGKAVGGTAVSIGDVLEPEGFAVVDGYLYFGAYDATHTDFNLYKLDADDVISIVVEQWDADYDWAVGAGVNGAFFFGNTDSTNGRELWVDDANGTRMISDLIPGDGSGYPYYFAPVGDEVCFSANSENSEIQDLYCVKADPATSLASTGLDSQLIGGPAVVALLAGGGLAVLSRRSRFTA